MNVSMFKTFHSENIDTFKIKGLQWANEFKTACFFDSNQYTDPYSAFDLFIAAGVKNELSFSNKESLKELEVFLSGNKSYLIGYFGYDLKNTLEDLFSKNPDYLNFPDFHFFAPQHIILIKGNEVRIESEQADEIWNEINALELKNENTPLQNSQIKSRCIDGP